MNPTYIVLAAIAFILGALAVPYVDIDIDKYKALDARCERHADYSDANGDWHTSWTCPNGEVVFD